PACLPCGDRRVFMRESLWQVLPVQTANRPAMARSRINHACVIDSHGAIPDMSRNRGLQKTWMGVFQQAGNALDNPACPESAAQHLPWLSRRAFDRLSLNKIYLGDQASSLLFVLQNL
ncbi:MAG: hypothetical protein Q8J78_04100, partial [Moraxellaceae bacterium]|nr:hypothetical protein [Moraxellaceae bacterium]